MTSGERRRAAAAICRKAGCGETACEGAEWCPRHHEEIAARRALLTDPTHQEAVDVVLHRRYLSRFGQQPAAGRLRA
jgi:hypothetical protein